MLMFVWENTHETFWTVGGKANKRDWVMNLNDRSYLSVFHEYVRRALQKQPVYEFKQLGEYLKILDVW